MNISRLTEKVARVEAEQKKIRRFDINLADAIFDGGSEMRSGRRTYTPERIKDSELSFLSDVKQSNLTSAEAISEAAKRHGIDETRLGEMRGRYFVDLSQEERVVLDRLKTHPFRTPGSAVEASLEQKGFIHGLLPQEQAYLAAMAKLEFSADRELAISMLRTRHGISAEMHEAFQKAGILELPSIEQVQWLRAFEGGSGTAELKTLADQLGIKIWALKNRVQVDEMGERKANVRPTVMHGELLVFDSPKVRWRREPSSELAKRQLSPLLPERKDLRLLNSSAENLGTWQAVRLKRLMDTRKADKPVFDAHSWGLLSPMERAAVLALGEIDLTKGQIAFRQENATLFDDVFKTKERAQRIGNDEFFFLAALRRDPGSMDKLASDYSVNTSKLKAQGFIDYLEDTERETLLQAMKEKNPAINENANLQILAGRGFIHLPQDDERNFLSYVAGTKPQDKAALMQAADRFLFDERRLVGLKARGFLNYLEENERTFLEELAADPKQSIEDLALKHDVVRPDRLKKRLTSSGVDLSIIVDAEPKFRLNPRVQYREERELLADRVSRPMSHKPHIMAKDIALFLSDLAQEPMSLGQVERLTELKAGGKSLADAVIPTNQELAFLRKIAWRKEDGAALLKIAQADFGLAESSVQRLIDGGFIQTRGKKYIPHQEPLMLREARIWLNSTDAMRKNLNMKEPHQELINVLKDLVDRADVGEKLMDYEIYFKVIRNEKLSKKESDRLDFMRENGLHPEGREFENWVKKEPKSWRMRDAKREAYLSHYEKHHGINLSILEFINTFKQATADQIIRQGLPEADLQRYANGLGSAGRHKILNKHVLLEKSGKPIFYYSIAHTGPISGRKFLEHRLNIAKADIPEKPQQRKDLLYHDLKVVDCVQEVIRLKKSEGKEVQKLLNEAMQFARAKGGLQNNQRQAGPAFMDAEIIFREETVPGQSSGSGDEVVAVEYGNYTLERMREKLQNCTFDHAYVFAKPDYIAKYEAHITVPNVTYIAMR